MAGCHWRLTTRVSFLMHERTDVMISTVDAMNNNWPLEVYLVFIISKLPYLPYAIKHGSLVRSKM